MDKIGSEYKNWKNVSYQENVDSFQKRISEYAEEQQKIRQGGGVISIQRQHDKNRLTARERIDNLLDNNDSFFEFGLYAAYDMYKEYGSPAAGGVIIGEGRVTGKDCVIVANDATVKAGAYFEMTAKKTIRAQQIALENNIPIIYQHYTSNIQIT